MVQAMGLSSQSFSHQSLPVILLGEVWWLNDSLVLCSFLILILHVSECTARLHDDGAVAKCCTAGTVHWGVIWGLVAIKYAGFPLSLYGWFLLLSASLPSHLICLIVGSNLWDLCFMSASRKSFVCCCACLVITCTFLIETSLSNIWSSLYENASLFHFWICP